MPGPQRAYPRASLDYSMISDDDINFAQDLLEIFQDNHAGKSYLINLEVTKDQNTSVKPVVSSDITEFNDEKLYVHHLFVSNVTFEDAESFPSSRVSFDESVRKFAYYIWLNRSYGYSLLVELVVLDSMGEVSESLYWEINKGILQKAQKK